MTEPTRVFVVDDHELVRKGLIDLIDAEEDLTVVGSAANVADALFHFVTVDADIAVLDVRLPDGNGIELCRELISINPRVKVLMLTSFQDDEALLGAVLGGASGYLIKDIKNLELLSSIRAVALGKSFLDTKLISSVTNRLRENKNPASEIYELTDQEQRVLEFIGQGMTNREIAKNMFLAEKTIKNYVSSLLRKLGLERRTQAAAMAVRLSVGRN
ncbi:MAG: DNA-binding response regulator [Actinobacteria bacterium]|nr:DNA-binding response regulator [Actinomycetota bacterium]NCV41583.1 DNA-binding response regulator [Actinomycetota bacterium]NCV82283.1 DNA-binding response regulator [Actinomycetota bacterium]NCW43012.1 DNA-binding response regulator [Actinomycetota bacterium]NCW71555.1 DNA-binding response regulator [Actinomycetota bacterium]